ncbi:MAG: sel1 repeat family protein [Deltaproteobacteria bacterium]|jgi:hypothetical protein|nr:sel1 repeat family protein [Deltaproteobacteria bacterium]
MTFEPSTLSESPEELFETGKKFYFSGRDSANDPQVALAYFEKAAQLGFPPAQRLLGFCFLEGQIVERDLERARHWLELASRGGDPQAAFALAKLCALGQGTPKDWGRAYRLLNQPLVANLPEALALMIRLKEELRNLYPALIEELKREENILRRDLPLRRQRFIQPFLSPGRAELNLEEFELWLALNLGRATPANTLLALRKCLTKYYETFAPTPAS